MIPKNRLQVNKTFQFKQFISNHANNEVCKMKRKTDRSCDFCFFATMFHRDKSIHIYFSCQISIVLPAD